MINFIANIFKPVVSSDKGINSIPNAVIKLILDSLSNKDQCSLFKTCKRFRTLSPSNFFWRFANSRQCFKNKNVWANHEVFITYSPRNRKITHINSNITVYGKGIDGEIITYFNNTIIVKRNSRVIKIKTDNNSEAVQGLYNDNLKGEGLWHYEDPNGYHYFWKNEKYLRSFKATSAEFIAYEFDVTANELKDEIPNLKYYNCFQNPYPHLQQRFHNFYPWPRSASIRNVQYNLAFRDMGMKDDKVVAKFEISKNFLVYWNSNDIHVCDVMNGKFLCRIKPLKNPSSISLLDGKELSIICKYPDGQSEFFTSFKGKVL